VGGFNDPRTFIFATRLRLKTTKKRSIQRVCEHFEDDFRRNVAQKGMFLATKWVVPGNFEEVKHT